MQGQILAARHGWRWLSTGQLLRDSHDPELMRQIQSGNLVSDDIVNRIVADALARAKDIGDVILDGYPRNVEQAQQLLATEQGAQVEVALVLDVTRDEILKRLQLRGRTDDTPEAIDKRLGIYQAETQPILAFLSEKGIPVVHVAGVGTVGQIHDAIEHELVSQGLIKGL